MANGNETPPSTTDKNPFSLLAYVLFKVRHALEDREDADRPPRWVRIARGAQYKQEALGSIVSGAVNGMAETLSYMVELTLDLEELLFQTDAAKAIAEVVLRMINAMTDQSFQAGIQALVGANSLGDLGTVLNTVNGATNQIEDYLEYIPEPEDVRGLGHELYRMLAITQKKFPRNADGTVNINDTDIEGTDHLVQDDSGKVRLIAWSYAHGVTSRGLGPNEANEEELFKFGMRRLPPTPGNADLPQRSRMVWEDGEDKVDIFNVAFTGQDNAKDIAELVALLKDHGYNDPAMTGSETTITTEIRRNLMKFQAINELPVTGEVDNDTINRLMNLDFARANLRRAKPFDANFQWPWGTQPADPPVPTSGTLELINPGADNWEDEGIALVPRQPHPYYEIPVSPRGQLPASSSNWPKAQGWISDASGTPRFVALHSRRRNLDDANQPGRFTGGKFSEGEAARGGRFFFAARHTQPWIDARQGTPPANDSLHANTTLAAGTSRSRMYQWIPLPARLRPGSLVTPGPGNWKLYFYASALQRSLYTDRGQVTKVPDQGLIRLELYGSDVFTNGTVSVRDEAAAKAQVVTEPFPPNAATTDQLSIDEVDSKRQWILRQTERVEAAAGTVALLLVAEGIYQSAFDIDAYFDDFRVHYEWEKVTAP
jgi:hypothetical protein